MQVETFDLLLDLLSLNFNICVILLWFHRICKKSSSVIQASLLVFIFWILSFLLAYDYTLVLYRALQVYKVWYNRI